MRSKPDIRESLQRKDLSTTTHISYLQTDFTFICLLKYSKICEFMSIATTLRFCNKMYHFVLLIPYRLASMTFQNVMTGQVDGIDFSNCPEWVGKYNVSQNLHSSYNSIFSILCAISWLWHCPECQNLHMLQSVLFYITTWLTCQIWRGIIQHWKHQTAPQHDLWLVLTSLSCALAFVFRNSWNWK